MSNTKFHHSNCMDGQVINEVQNFQYLASQALESIPTNQTDQDNVPPPAPMFAPVVNTNIGANDNVKLQMLEIIKYLHE